MTTMVGDCSTWTPLVMEPSPGQLSGDAGLLPVRPSRNDISDSHPFSAASRSSSAAWVSLWHAGQLSAAGANSAPHCSQPRALSGLMPYEDP